MTIENTIQVNDILIDLTINSNFATFFSNVGASIQTAKKSVADFETTLQSAMNPKVIQETTKAVMVLGDKIDDATKAQESFKKKTKKIKNSMMTLQKATSKAMDTSVIEATSKAMTNLGNDIGDATKEQKKFKKQTQKVTKDFGKLENAVQGAMDLQNVQSATTAMMGFSSSIDKATQSQAEFNNSADGAADAYYKNKMDNEPIEKAKQIFGKIASVAQSAASYMVQGTDAYADNQAKINSMNDGLQSTEALNKMILASAQNTRTSYQDMVGVVTELGTTASGAFGSNEEMLAFSELMTKSFKIAGASAEEQGEAISNLSQAMADGQLQGDALNSVIQNAPVLAQAIADEMGVTMGQLTQMGEEGKITSDVVKDAMFNSAGSINEQFASIPMKFSEAVLLIKNKITGGLMPAFQKILDFINSDEGQGFLDGVSKAMTIVAAVAEEFVGGMVDGMSFIAENWGIIAPIALGLGVIIGGLALIMAGHNAVLTISSFLNAALGASTAAATTAQTAFNMALLASPITWVVIAVIALVAAFFAVVGAINKATGSSLSAVGIMVGAFNAVGAFIGNVFKAVGQVFTGVFDYIGNYVVIFTNFFGNVFKDPVGSIIRLFADLTDNVLGFLEKITKGIDVIFGSNLSGTIGEWRSSIQEIADSAEEKYGNGQYEKKAENVNTADMLADHGVNLERTGYAEAYNNGYATGEGKMDEFFGDSGFGEKGTNSAGTEDFMAGLLSGNTINLQDSNTFKTEKSNTFEMENGSKLETPENTVFGVDNLKMSANKDIEILGDSNFTMPDLAPGNVALFGPDGQYVVGQKKSPTTNPNDSGDNGNRTDTTVDLSKENLKLLQEMAGMKAIQNFVTLKPHVEVSTGDIKNGMEFDDIVTKITTTINEEMAVGAREVYNVG